MTIKNSNPRAHLKGKKMLHLDFKKKKIAKKSLKNLKLKNEPGKLGNNICNLN
jgi:hypothetical protein